MSRYIKYYSFNARPNEVFNMANQFLITHGFVYKNYHGENVFQKGQGWAVGPKFVKLSFNGNILQLEAWVKFAITPGLYSGEMDLKGTAGIATKKPLQGIMDNLEMQLMQFGCTPIAPPQGYYTPAQAAPPVQQYAAPTQQHTPPAQPYAQPSYTPPVQQPIKPQITVKNGGKCLRCGNPLGPEAIFCSQCGLKRN